MDNAELEDLLLGMPAKIKAQEKVLLLLVIRQNTNDREIEDIEAPIKADIGLNCNFKNPEQRKGALVKILKDNTGYQAKVKNQPGYDLDVKTAQVELAYLRDMFRAYLAIAGMVQT